MACDSLVIMTFNYTLLEEGAGQGKLYIIVDALDECPNKSGSPPPPREKTLLLVKELVSQRHQDICISSGKMLIPI